MKCKFNHTDKTMEETADISAVHKKMSFEFIQKLPTPEEIREEFPYGILRKKQKQCGLKGFRY